jgi:hypothetical protein
MFRTTTCTLTTISLDGAGTCMTVDFGVGSLQHLGDSRNCKLCESFTFSRLKGDPGSSSLSHQPNCWIIFWHWTRQSLGHYQALEGNFTELHLGAPWILCLLCHRHYKKPEPCLHEISISHYRNILVQTCQIPIQQQAHWKYPWYMAEYGSTVSVVSTSFFTIYFELSPLVLADNGALYYFPYQIWTFFSLHYWLHPLNAGDYPGTISRGPYQRGSRISLISHFCKTLWMSTLASLHSSYFLLSLLSVLF